jgi:prepilin-type N-terminal cleavage/methylation domain-containing protein
MRSEKGFSLIEVIISILIVAILAVGLMQGLNVAIIARDTANTRTTSESLAVSQIEKIKSGPYSVAQAGTGNYTSTIPSLANGYRFASVSADNNTVVNSLFGIPWDVVNDVPWTATTPSDPGIQKIIIIVQSNRGNASNGAYKEIFRLIDFKVNR